MAKRKQQNNEEEINLWDEIAEEMRKTSKFSAISAEDEIKNQRTEHISPYHLDFKSPNTEPEDAVEGVNAQSNRGVSTTVDRMIDQVFIVADQAKRKGISLFHTLKNQWELNMQPKVASGLQLVVRRVISAGSLVGQTTGTLVRRWELKCHLQKVSLWVNEWRDYAEHHKKQMLIGFSVSVAGVAVVTLILGGMTSYEYLYNDKVLGVVKNQQDVYEIVELVDGKLASAYQAEIKIDKEQDISFRRIFAWQTQLDSQEDILNRLTYMKDMKVTGYGIYVNNKLTAVLDSRATAKSVLDEITNQYVKQEENIVYDSIGFSEDVEIKDVETKLGSLERKDDVMAFMLTGAVEKKVHLVQSGETFSSIAKLYGMSQSDLMGSNPEVIPEKLQIDQEISLIRPVPIATVETVETVTYRETIPFEVAYEETSTLYKGENTVKSQGSNGEREVQAKIVRSNGVETEKVELSSSVVTASVAQVVLQGTKEQPALIGTGRLIYPTRGRLTSRYGTRWGRMHKGIDLAAPIGTPIKAADGGTVLSAGYNGALGYMVKIDHGGGKVTVYGHCSKLHVTAGQKVFQGQHIANVGNTGNSTGPHLHFEVHVNGNTQNPLSYLN